MKQTASHRKSLLDLDRLPTKEKLRAFFLSNDWTTNKPYDFSKWESERTEELNYTKSVLDPVWNETAKKYGQKAPSICYTDDYPPEVLKNNVSDIVCGSVVKIANDDELLKEALNPYFDDENVVENADKFVHNAVDTLMEVMDYGGVVSTSKEIGTPEDFSKIPLNYPRNDFEKKYNHAGAKTKVDFSSVQAETELQNKKVQSYTVDELVENSVLVSEFFTILDDTDKKILKYVLSGYTQNEIAEEMGFANHSVVSKHMKKIRKMYLVFDPECKRK